MKKIVFFDIDGTLLDDEKQLPDSALEALEKLKKTGVYIAFATGRAPFMVEQLCRDLDIHSYVCFNGQYVVYEKEVLYKNPLRPAHIQDLHSYAAKNGHPLIYMNEKTMKTTTENHVHVRDSLKSLKLPYPRVNGEFFRQSHIYQTLVFCTEDEEGKYIGKYDYFDFIRWHRYSLDVIPPGGSKAVGIKKIIDHLGVRMENVYAFGDGLNDIEMIKKVGVGVAMGNAVDEVKQQADFVTKDVAKDGIYHSLKTLQLI